MEFSSLQGVFRNFNVVIFRFVCAKIREIFIFPNLFAANISNNSKTCEDFRENVQPINISTYQFENEKVYNNLLIYNILYILIYKINLLISYLDILESKMIC